MENKDSSRSVFQLIWGMALLLAGVGVFVRIPQVMPQIEQIELFKGSLWIIRFCFYVMGILLLGGGIQKLIGYFRTSPPGSSQRPSDTADS
jgi:hypothetical protein